MKQCLYFFVLVTLSSGCQWQYFPVTKIANANKKSSLSRQSSVVSPAGKQYKQERRSQGANQVNRGLGKKIIHYVNDYPPINESLWQVKRNAQSSDVETKNHLDNSLQKENGFTLSPSSQQLFLQPEIFPRTHSNRYKWLLVCEYWFSNKNFAQKQRDSLHYLTICPE